MDVNIINPILSAFNEIIPQIGFQTIRKTNITLVGSTFNYSGVLINLSVIGSIKGVILIGMDLNSAKRFASKMMMGMEVNDFDTLAQSAVSEMGNMVCANACTHYSQVGIDGLDISPPTLMVGQGGEATLPVPQTIVVHFLVDDIEIQVYIGLMNSK
ncbi:chemotaxis protein CheX [Sporomusaceae bacterium BoRhaA]|uniref:chemotaxis protein CheX n=1 Tax=Pelorhabdus rhamnosifermentans TaxID=2772457 RepID=UPI001C0632CD|nr:chemotaxis protein CheX [Pelorhabdus rhamnosifermentans]MBU2700120.1 chemotaxis protein CheX [Pelorhabdus rhamnosifermentans]